MPRRQMSAGNKLFAAGRYAKAEPKLAAAVAELERLHRDDPERADVVIVLAAESYTLGVCLHHERQQAEAVVRLGRAVELYGGLHDSQGAGWRQQLAAAQQALGNTYCDLFDWPRALAASRTAVDLWRQVPGKATPRYTALALRGFAHVRAKARLELDEALQAVDEALAMHATLLSAGDPTASARETHVTELVRAMVLRAVGREDEAARIEAATMPLVKGR
jgi:tetratricopeptide (TPR) repeat protein